MRVIRVQRRDLTTARSRPILAADVRRIIALQVLELLIFAVLAAVVLYQLYAVLGRKVGRQPEDKPEAAQRAALDSPPTTRLPADSPQLTGLATVKAKDPTFDVDNFLQGARGAFEIIVRAFAAADRDTLRPLLSAEVLAAFETVMVQREAEGRSEVVEFLQPPRADLEDSSVTGDIARLKVRFLAEFRSRSKGPEGEAVDDRRTAEVWTFERPLVSRDPNWTLARVEAAQA
jgi:predicted lipid-binding transport protein (Tim44 family)